MDRNLRKNQWRKAQAAKIREERVIKGYVETKYPEIYEEASAFYNRLNEKYPTKCDLRKTNEYCNLKTSTTQETINRSGKRYPNIKKALYVNAGSFSKAQDTIKNFQDNFELKIPLMSNVTKNPTPGPAESDTQLDKEITEIMSMIREDPSLAGFFKLNHKQDSTPDQIENPPVEPAEIVISTSDMASDMAQSLPDNEIEKMIHELQQDPNLKDIFSEIEIDIPETSPLEDEVLFW